MQRIFLFLLMTAPATPALSIPTTIDITGVITGYETVASDGTLSGDLSGTLSTLAVTASITFDPDLGPTPSITAFSNGYELTQRSDAVPVTEFAAGAMTWANGIFIPQTVPVPTGATVVGGDGLRIDNITDIIDSFIIGDVLAYGTPDFV